MLFENHESAGAQHAHTGGKDLFLGEHPLLDWAELRAPVPMATQVGVELASAVISFLDG